LQLILLSEVHKQFLLCLFDVFVEQNAAGMSVRHDQFLHGKFFGVQNRTR